MAASDNKVSTLPENAKLVVRIEPITVRPKEAAKLLGISCPKVYDLVAREDFDGAFRLDGCLLISVESLKKWVRDQTQKQGGG